MATARPGGGEMVVASGKKEKMTKAARGGRPKKQRAADEAEQEARRVLVARLLMERKTYREIVTTIEEMPEEKRPKNVSLSTVSRDVAVLRAEWAAKRGELMEELVGEEVERLNQLEKV